MTNARLRLAFAGKPCFPREPLLWRARGTSGSPHPPAHGPTEVDQ
jgi:hypothetical protein